MCSNMNEKTVVYHHPQLGQIKGVVRSDATVQFRNVPYADIPARFRQSRVAIPNPSSAPETRNFTARGVACPQTPHNPAAYGGRLPGEPDRAYDEFSCLTLMISVPKSTLSSSRKKLLPVMVHVHGGAFSEGNHTADIHGVFSCIECT